MSGYATAERQSHHPLRAIGGGGNPPRPVGHLHGSEAPGVVGETKMLDGLIAAIADRVAEAVTARLASSVPDVAPEWLDSRGADNYLGLHRDTLRKLAAERAIPAVQDGLGCKLFFLRTDLDEWRRAGGRAAHVASTVAA
jgi:excisionase family DNA binding protein